MKFKHIFSLLALGFLFSCSKDFLDETPVDFIAAENAFKTYDDFNLSIAGLHDKVRDEFYSIDGNFPFDYTYGTDIVFDGQPDARRWTPYTAVMQPSGGNRVPETHWRALYKIVSESNMAISRLGDVELTPVQERNIEGRARFFRALAYRTLVYLYGGVPISLEEIKEPKYDFVRATKKEVLEQCILDLTFASNNLPGITQVKDGEIHALAAAHLLAEVYIANGEPKKAILAATKVIDDPNTDLMTRRFGSRATENGRDVYWDLFRGKNQNRTSGNTESLYVIQYETDVPGGAMISTTKDGGFYMERHHGPNIGSLRVGGVNPFLYPVSDYTGGRGIGWAISTKHFSNTIWVSDFTNDMRNANHNFVRVFTYNNPQFPLYYGKTISTENPPAGITVPGRNFYAYQTKGTTPGEHPDNLYIDKTRGLLNANAGATYADQYMFRLAETYLLRAEAYMNDNQQGLAAADINVVRARANAKPVAEANVNIDYILDERMRELGVEEKRRLTLMRLGLLYNRVTRFNSYYKEIQEFHNLWPIPFVEIERNTGAVLDQNPGYVN
ncbi:Starch-binding associating with outer membrane [Flavobacterium fluvii]|uniref:Starch-binding associating with outer membrane n=1 Tax=Flavobacterium fluvii TaxID=468056 RepID=A0A1M5PKB7_9FLAO|nr:RagB/SusD family nutrient uptake outer membrane protein [Flavobacterium fluvii]SHH02157.1 Starch-binding associating with outer membrane [Flavobacterium fluvii]